MSSLAEARFREGFSGELVEEIFSSRLSDFPRIERLKRAILSAQPAISLDRSRLLTDYHEKNGFDLDRPQIRQASSLNYILEKLSPVIFPEELIVGSATEHRLGCVMFPEFQAAVIWPELLSLPRRRRHPVAVSEEAIEEFSFRIFPYFQEKNIVEWAKRMGGYSDSLQLMERMVFYLVAHPNGVSHLIPNYPAAIELGFNRIRELAREKREAVSGRAEEAKKRREFYEAVDIVSAGVIKFAENYARECERLAAGEAEVSRREELLELGRILKRVPAEPARTFWEALESMWITHAAVLQENSDLAVSFGRMDQFMWPYFERDLAEGRLDLKRALELIMALYIKTNDHTPLVPTPGESMFSGSATNQSITLSGLSPAGADATNPLSYLFLRALDLTKLREPNVDARFHAGSPPLWREKVLEVVRATGAAPALYNDEAIVPALMAKGATPADARDYGVIGCVETTVQGKAYGMTGSILLNLPAILELTFNNGVHTLSGLQIGPKTGRLRDFSSWDEFWSAFQAQLQFMADQSVDAEKRYERAHEDLHPVPLLSAMLDGPMDKGKDATAGGARYNSSGVWAVGLADVADSLAALKKLVFEEKRIRPAEMESALAADFAGFEKTRALCLSHGPKYGTDDPEADRLAVRLVDAVDSAFGKHLNYRGGPYHIGYWTMTIHTGYGKLTGALPSGRKKGQALASGATPVSGAARKGPSAALSSTARLPAAGMANCIAHNHKIPAALLREPGKMKVLAQLVNGFFKMGGMQIQFVIADRETLVAAMNDPELAKDLLVRVSGYTAYFGDLDRAMQEEIIARTEDAI